MGFTAAQAARLTGCSLSQLSSWERIGHVVPTQGPNPLYSFQDLVALRVVVSLLDAGLSLARIRRAVRYLVETDEDVASLALVTDGDTVWACRDDGEILDALARDGAAARGYPDAGIAIAAHRLVDLAYQSAAAGGRPVPCDPSPG